eukprot:scaffold18126_cov44-Phaeocystis_antarctica.AAC.1
MCCAVHTSWDCRSKEWNPNSNPIPNPNPNPNSHLVELAVEEVTDQRPVLLRWQQPARQRAQRLDRTGGRQACNGAARRVLSSGGHHYRARARLENAIGAQSVLEASSLARGGFLDRLCSGCGLGAAQGVA